jgi:hypothetical protein
MIQFQYLVAFVYDNGTKFGRTDVVVPAPIASPRDMAIVEADLRTAIGQPDVMVLAFSLFTDPRAGGGA